MMMTMSEPIHSTPDPPSLRFRLTMRGMMFVVAVVAVLLSLWIPTIRLMIDVRALELEQFWKTGFLLLAETVVVYYITLAGVIAHRVITASGSDKRLSRLLIFGPVILILVILYISQLLDTLARLPWI